MGYGRLAGCEYGHTIKDRDVNIQARTNEFQQSTACHNLREICESRAPGGSAKQCDKRRIGNEQRFRRRCGGGSCGRPSRMQGVGAAGSVAAEFLDRHGHPGRIEGDCAGCEHLCVDLVGWRAGVVDDALLLGPDDQVMMD